MRKHKFVFGHTVLDRPSYRVCKKCGQYPQSSIHRIRGWWDRLNQTEKVMIGKAR